jgi:hypothetical protein
MMVKMNRFIAGWLAVALVLVTSACSRAETTPTPRPEELYTQAAQTVQAGLTQTAMLQPTSAATQTPAPTNTTTPTLAATTTSAVSPTNPVAPTSPRPSVADKAEWVSQNPADGAVLAPGQEFTLTWTVKNIGTTTWNTKYQLRYYLANAALRFGASDIKFPKEVKPGESLDLTVNMKAPSAGGDYMTIWVLTNDQGVNFYTLTLSIKVSGAAAPTTTQTATSGPTATTEPTATETTTP